jgi:hypothetical protein
VYAFGIILWEILTRKEPYEDKEPMQIVVEVVNDNLRPDIPVLYRDSPLIPLIKDCWAGDPDRRPPFRVVVDRLDVLVAQTGNATPQASRVASGSISGSRGAPTPTVSQTKTLPATPPTNTGGGGGGVVTANTTATMPTPSAQQQQQNGVPNLTVIIPTTTPSTMTTTIASNATISTRSNGIDRKESRSPDPDDLRL